MTAALLLLQLLVTAEQIQPPVSSFELANGMRVVLVPTDGKVVAVGLGVRAGVFDEPEGRCGISHLLEHLFLQGPTESFPRPFETLTRNGPLGSPFMDCNAETMWNLTYFYALRPADRLDETLRVFAEKLDGVRLTAEILARERPKALAEVRHVERSMRSNPVLRRQLESLGRLPKAGIEDDIQKLTLGELEAYRARQYRPDRTILVIHGTMDAAATRRRVEKLFGSLRARSPRRLTAAGGTESPRPLVREFPCTWATPAEHAALRLAGTAWVNRLRTRGRAYLERPADGSLRVVFFGDDPAAIDATREALLAELSDSELDRTKVEVAQIAWIRRLQSDPRALEPGNIETFGRHLVQTVINRLVLEAEGGGPFLSTLEKLDAEQVRAAARKHLVSARRTTKAKGPNVLLILVDDLGWMDLHCQGNERLDTPHIDRLAEDGMRFTRAYSAAPVCSPTRAAILTGKSPARLRITNHIPDQKRFIPENPKLLPAPMLDHLPVEHVTLAERLKESGYATAFLGKWHLAGRSGRQGLGDTRFYPERQGFDVNVGGCAYGGPPTYFDPYRIHNLPPRRKGEYLPDRLADEAIDFLRSHRDDPFLLALWNYTVHWPMEAPEALIEKYRERRGPGIKDPRYAAMIEAFDASIGRILAALDELDLRGRTLVVFTSDNGGYSGVADNRPLRAGKGYLYEGGIRVPLIVRWPGRVEAGTRCHTPVISTDLYPTILAATGTPPAPDEVLDGESILPLLRGTGELRRDAIYFHYPNYAWHRSNRLGGAIISGDLKLIERFDDGSVELYNVAKDIDESDELAAKMPEEAARLSRKLRAWRAATGASMPTTPKKQ